MKFTRDLEKGTGLKYLLIGGHQGEANVTTYVDNYALTSGSATFLLCYFGQVVGPFIYLFIQLINIC